MGEGVSPPPPQLSNILSGLFNTLIMILRRKFQLFIFPKGEQKTNVAKPGGGPVLERKNCLARIRFIVLQKVKN